MSLEESKNPNGGNRQGFESANQPTTKGKPMNSLVNFDNKIQSMTSLEISELVEKRHDNVKRTIESLVNQSVIARPQIEVVQNTVNNRAYETDVYVFTGEQGKLDSITVVAQLCPEFTARLVKRWYELEQQLAKPTDPMQLLTDPHALRHALLTYSEKVIALENKVVEMQPDVDAFARISKADGSLCITDAAKALGMGQKQLHNWLSANDWIYKRAGNKHWLGYSDKEKAGYLEHKVDEIPLTDGRTKIREQVRITPKGLTKLAKIFAQGEAA